MQTEDPTLPYQREKTDECRCSHMSTSPGSSNPRSHCESHSRGNPRVGTASFIAEKRSLSSLHPGEGTVFIFTRLTSLPSAPVYSKTVNSGYVLGRETQLTTSAPAYKMWRNTRDPWRLFSPHPLTEIIIKEKGPETAFMQPFQKGDANK